MRLNEDSVTEHGPEYACYSGGPGEPYFQPALGCLCGWETGRTETWEDIGRMFDEHLAEAKKEYIP